MTINNYRCMFCGPVVVVGATSQAVRNVRCRRCGTSCYPLHKRAKALAATTQEGRIRA